MAATVSSTDLDVETSTRDKHYYVPRKTRTKVQRSTSTLRRVSSHSGDRSVCVSEREMEGMLGGMLDRVSLEASKSYKKTTGVGTDGSIEPQKQRIVCFRAKIGKNVAEYDQLDVCLS